MKKPISTSVKASSHTPQYKMHKYFARRPYNVFRNLIEHYTDEGDIVLDVFCGGGVTIFESLFLKRKVIGVDLNPLATFITEMQIKQVPIDELENLFNEFKSKMKKLYSHFYEFESREIEWIEWAYEVLCPKCGAKIVLAEANKVYKDDGKPKNGYYVCPNNECESNQSRTIGVKRTDCTAYSSVPLRVKLEDSTVITLQKDQAEKIRNQNFEEYLSDELVKPDDVIPQNWDRTHEDKLNKKGIIYFSDLFTRRNYILNVLIFNHILDLRGSISDDMLDCLYFAFSASLRYTNKMSRVTDNWENGNPTSMDKHAYWLPNQYIEANVLKALENRMDAVIRGLKYTEASLEGQYKKVNEFEELKQDNTYMILNQSSARLPLPDKSITAVITDPPYGSNVQYSELSSFWNVWLRSYRGLDHFIFNDDEAVINRKKSFEGFKDIHHYEDVLFRVFSECNRVLKDDGYLVFTFNNKNLKVWVALLKAALRAGFIIPKGGVIFQDFIQSYKNTSHLKYSGNVHGDFIYSFVKGNHHVNSQLLNYDPIEYIQNHITTSLEELFNEKDSYTTTELYQEIFYDLISILCDFIAIDLEEDNDWFTELEKQSNDFIDNLLKKELEFKDERWYKKEVKTIDIFS